MKAFLPSLHLEHHSEWGMGKVKRRVGLAVGVGCSGMGCSRCSASGFGINCVTLCDRQPGSQGSEHLLRGYSGQPCAHCSTVGQEGSSRCCHVLHSEKSCPALDFQTCWISTSLPCSPKPPGNTRTAPRGAEGLGEEVPLTRRVMAPQTISPPGCFSSKILILNRTSFKARIERKMGHGAT